MTHRVHWDLEIKLGDFGAKKPITVSITTSDTESFLFTMKYPKEMESLLWTDITQHIQEFVRAITRILGNSSLTAELSKISSDEELCSWTDGTMRYLKRDIHVYPKEQWVILSMREG